MWWEDDDAMNHDPLCMHDDVISLDEVISYEVFLYCHLSVAV
jgi:hypothetical protein